MSLKNVLSDIFRNHEKTTLVEAFPDEQNPGVTYKVVDRTVLFFPWNDTRRLEFRSGSIYAYSTIYLHKCRRDQPIYFSVHQLVHSYLPRLSRLENALVLGCAGCSIPRFLALSAPNCRITGIEYSSKMIEIAQKYFINDPTIFRNFQLIHADAFSYVHDTSEKYHLVYVDLFLADKNHPQIFADDFLRDLDSITAEESITIINLLNLSKDDATKYLLRFVEMFPAAYVFNERFHYYGVLIKTAKPSLLRHFEKKAVKSLRMEERFVSPTLNPR